MTVGPQQFWLSPARAGQKVTLWIDATTVHLSIGGWRIKTVPSRLTEWIWPGCAGLMAAPQGRHPLGRHLAYLPLADVWRWTGWSTASAGSPC
jgi:hypothetical protein